MTIEEQINSQFLTMVPAQLQGIFVQRDGGYILSTTLNDKVNDIDIITKKDNRDQLIWQCIGLKLSFENRTHESIEIFFTLYKKMLRWQIKSRQWTHKGMPLVWISDNFKKIGYHTMAKRFAMLTLIEDSIRDHQDDEKLNIQSGGIYFRLRHHYGMSHTNILRYSKEYFTTFNITNPYTFFPEYILLESDRQWITEYPNNEEFSYYLINSEYLEFLKAQTGDQTGKALVEIPDHVDPPFRFMMTHYSGMMPHPFIEYVL